jgi:hypothetical protein
VFTLPASDLADETLTCVEPQVIVSLASAGVAALAVAASLVTTLLSLRSQRENMRATLDAQERLSVSQERGSTWSSWPERAEARTKLMDDAIDLIAWIRAESQGSTSRGYFMIWRLS